MIEEVVGDMEGVDVEATRDVTEVGFIAGLDSTA